MYQCCVPEHFQDFLRFLLSKDNSLAGEVLHCPMTWLAYGLLCSQSGAQVCLRKTILNNEVKVSPESVNSALSSYLASFAFVSELQKLFCEIKILLESRGLKLCKFGTNCEALQAVIPAEDLAPSFVPLSFDKDHDVAHKALGMKWKPKSDLITFSLALDVHAYTKRGILATYSQIFVPIGVIQPLLIALKLLIRSLYALKLGWDDKIPSEQAKSWKK